MSKNRGYISRNVLMTGFTSLFTDVSSEMLYPLIQAFVRAITVSVGPVLGIMEGVAESLASLLKVFSGYYSDVLKKRKFFTIFGYSLSSLSKVLFFIPSIASIFFVRFFDKVGKGIRTAPRDALISESVPRTLLGKAFGFQRAMDFTGAFMGSAVLYILIKYSFPYLNDVVYGKGVVSPKAFYPIFIIAIISTVIGVVFLFFTKDEKVKEADVKKEILKPTLNFRKYSKNLQIFFLAEFVFTLGNSSNQFLLLQSSSLIGGLSKVILMYMLFNFVSAIFSTFFGGLSDKKGRKRLMVFGYLLYAVVYLSFGFITPDRSYLLWLCWPLYGLYNAMTKGVEKAFVAETAPEHSKGTALGFYNTIVGIGLLPASVIAGFLFVLSPCLVFIFGGVMALTASIMIWRLVD
ncbi:MAG: MFS transporter [Pseudomonadota bacterium]